MENFPFLRRAPCNLTTRSSEQIYRPCITFSCEGEAEIAVPLLVARLFLQSVSGFLSPICASFHALATKCYWFPLVSLFFLFLSYSIFCISFVSGEIHHIVPLLSLTVVPPLVHVLRLLSVIFIFVFFRFIYERTKPDVIICKICFMKKRNRISAYIIKSGASSKVPIKIQTRRSKAVTNGSNQSANNHVLVKVRVIYIDMNIIIDSCIHKYSYSLSTDG